jgi:pilus assembly protein Flp/PilA
LRSRRASRHRSAIDPVQKWSAATIERPYGSRQTGRSELSPRRCNPVLANLYLRLQMLLHREEGQGMVEYALILVLIAIVVILVLITLGNQVKNVFCNISGGLGQ